MKIQSILYLIPVFCLFSACNNKGTTDTTDTPVQSYQKVSPDFDADSAYTYIQKQTDFGPRVPNTNAHIECGDYLVSELKRFEAEVIEQKTELTTFDGTKLNARNIIGSYNTDKKQRILLFAHWDSRPFADKDPNEENLSEPVLGVNDGASGVGVLLETARIIQHNLLDVGVDIIFFDAEDYGSYSDSESWCLGSQYWARNPHVPNYTAKYGILLDMVGAKDAKFYKEDYSVFYAAAIVEKTWGIARKLGYGTFFIDKRGGAITDDHVPVNEIRRIPSINIIHTTADGNFFEHWHTTNDDMNNISRETLKAVGQTILEVIYTEKGE